MATEGATGRDVDRPLLVQLFEAAAAIMDLDEGQYTLELQFDQGHLRRWTALNRNNGHEALRRFDPRVAGIADLLRDRVELAR